MINKNIVRTLINSIEVAFIILWYLVIRKTLSNSFVYLVIGMAGTFCIFKFNMLSYKKLIRKEKIIINILTLLFNVCIFSSNYKIIFIYNKDIVSMIYYAIVILIGNEIIFFNLLTYIWRKYEGYSTKSDIHSRKNKVFVFFISFLIVCLVDMLYLFLIAYPSNIQYDGISQLSQIIKGPLIDHHPIYHTLIIKIFYSIGMSIFNNINAAMALYSVFQILVIASIFGYSMMTIYEVGASRKYIIISIIFQSLAPYNFSYSCTIWKDTLHAGMVLGFIVSLFRCRKNIGNNIANYTILFITSIGFCLLRNNGIYAYVIIIAVLIFGLYKNKNKMIIGTLVFSFIISFILKYPVIHKIKIYRKDLLELLSIPLQQICRVVYDNKFLDSYEHDMISRVADIDMIKKDYLSCLSDPMKDLIRENGGASVISVERLAYLKLWIRLGSKYPLEYIMAWIDQTEGYWSPSYPITYFFFGVVDNNDVGVYKENLSTIGIFYNIMIKKLADGKVASAITSPGLLTWIYIIIFSFYYLKNKKILYEVIPIFAILITLLISTPVFCEFRYIYPSFLVFPFVFYLGLNSK